MLYQHCAEKNQYRLVYPPMNLQEEIDKSLRFIKAGQFTEAGKTIRTVVETLWQMENLAIMTACTELPLAYRFSGLPAEREISSLQALSIACLDALYR